jgi:hypothetical protein
MCRLATLSDDSYAVALAELLATSHLAERKAGPADTPAGQHSTDPQRGGYRASGRS